MDGESSKRIKLDSLLHDGRLNLNLPSLSLKDLREITNDFSDENLLGQGGFGTVYKGLLQDGNTIAVKKLTSTMAGLQDKQYENEVRHLMRLIHPNIVQLVGYCYETEKELVLHNGKYVYAEKSERLLCLEYLPKGSLSNYISDASTGLDWHTRYKIIEGICYGLHYLHEEWQPSTPIIHRDLKPANILLDDNMMPKIADFGLSRLFGEEQTRTTTKNCSGTLGYMAPEYLNRGIITKELDIFGLGVIIIQVVTGKKDYPYKDDETSSQKFIDLVHDEWEKTAGYTTQEFDCHQIRRCIEIGLLCVKNDRKERPTTRRIIEMLTLKHAECSNETEAQLEHMVSSRNADQDTRLEPNHEHAASSGSNANIRLCFLNKWKPPIYTDKNITDENNAAIKVAVFEGDKMITTGPLSKAEIEILVLHGAFYKNFHDNWTEEAFDKHTVQGRNGQMLVLGTVQLTNGEVDLSQIHFKEGSRRKKFSMAARFCKSEHIAGRVREAIMEPTEVKDRRNKSTEKSNFPRLDDDVYRIEAIARDGAYHQRLQGANIQTVQDFLKALNKDPYELCIILNIRYKSKTWSKMTEHARKRILEGRQMLKAYQTEDGTVTLFFNCVHDLVGGRFGNNYIACEQFGIDHKALVKRWKQHVYSRLEDIPYNYISVDAGQPNPIPDNLEAYKGAGAPGNYPSDAFNLVPEPIDTHANFGPMNTEPLTKYDCQGQGIPLPFLQQTTLLSIGPDWQQTAQVPTDFPDLDELMNFNMLQQSSRASPSSTPSSDACATIVRDSTALNDW